MVPRWDHGEVRRDDTMKNESQMMATETHKMEQTVVMTEMSGQITMECVRCGFRTNGYKRGRLKKRLENHLLKCPIVTHGIDKPKTNTAKGSLQ